MKQNVQLVIPMCGGGTRFSKNGICIPKPLIQLNNKPFFYWAALSLLNRYSKRIHSLSFVVLKEHIDVFKIDDVIRNYFKNAKIIILDRILNGPVYTCSYACNFLEKYLPVAFCDCDIAFESNNPEEFNVSSLLCFESNNEAYSYIQIDNDNKVIRTIEKECISNNAICGCYFYKTVNDFLFAANKIINNGNNNEKYMSSTFNALIGDNRAVAFDRVIWNLSFGTPEEYIEAKRYSNLLDSLEAQWKKNI